MCYKFCSKFVIRKMEENYKKVAFNLHHSKSTPTILLRNNAHQNSFCQPEKTSFSSPSSSKMSPCLSEASTSSSIDSLLLVVFDQVRSVKWLLNTGFVSSKMCFWNKSREISFWDLKVISLHIFWVFLRLFLGTYLSTY